MIRDILSIYGFKLHRLGVAHLARRQAKHLQMTQPELNITDRDVECVELAGLCHDLGHGPWSHVWDSLFIPKALYVLHLFNHIKVLTVQLLMIDPINNGDTKTHQK